MWYVTLATTLCHFFFFFFFFTRIEVVYLFIKEMPAICPVILDSLAVFWQQIWFAVFLIPISS